MGKWYLRDRGQVCGPFTTEQILEMRDRGTVASYHEVSADKRSWKVVDDVPALSRSAPARRKAAARPADGDGPPDEPAGGGGPDRFYTRVVAGVVALVVLGGVALAVVLATRSGPADTAKGDPPGPGGRGPRVPEGVITFTDQTPEEERDRVHRESVGLVVAGLEVTFQDGRVWEVPAYRIEEAGGRSVLTFGNAIDLLPPKLPPPPGFHLVDFGTGSGFAVTPAGHVLTNKHVVEAVADFPRGGDRDVLIKYPGVKRVEPRVWVFFGREQRCAAAVVHVSGEYDVAVLRLDREPRHYFALCETAPTDVPKLKNLSSLGFPGVDRDALTPKDRADALLRRAINKGPIQLMFADRAFEFSSRDGTITNKAFQNRMRADQRDSWVFQHSAQIFGGNSGGPLTTGDGTVLGINTWSKDTPGFNYALTLPQLRTEIASHAGGTTWRGFKK